MLQGEVLQTWPGTRTCVNRAFTQKGSDAQGLPWINAGLNLRNGLRGDYCIKHGLVQLQHLL